MQKIVTIITIGITAFILLLLITLTFVYRHKPVHFSIDDVNKCLVNLTRDSDKYASAMDEPFLATLKKMHERTGAKFTLYVFENHGDFELREIPSKYHEDFKKEASWLRFGFHAPFAKNTADSTVFMTSYIRTDSIITERLGNLHTDILRLEYFFATPREVEALHKYGVRVLLSADDDRTSYSLPAKSNSILIDKELLSDKSGVTFKRTDARMEKTSPLLTLISNATDDEIFLFTHEWCFFENTKEINFYLYFFYLMESDFFY